MIITPLITPAGRDGSTQFDNSIDLAPFIAFQDEKAWAPLKAMMFSNIRVFYSLIPKNACTSILSALVKANGLTNPWFQKNNRIHNIQKNYHAFRNIEEFQEDTCKIIAFRDPFARLLSAFRNKLISEQPEAVFHQRFFEQRLGKKIAEIRLSEIVRLIDRMPHWAVDEHFAPQWSFIFYDRYDLIINADLPIISIDAGGREIPVHAQNRSLLRTGEKDIGDATIQQIRDLGRRTGALPALTASKRIFESCIQAGGNFEKDQALHVALRLSRKPAAV